MKITNYQKQNLKMLEISFTSTTTFEQAQALIAKAELEKKETAAFWAKNNDLSGSEFFSRWNED